jgi:hypothetical protein
MGGNGSLPCYSSVAACDLSGRNPARNPIAGLSVEWSAGEFRPLSAKGFWAKTFPLLDKQSYALFSSVAGFYCGE